MAYRIRELREKKKLTQEQLSQMSGVSRATIVQLENNEEHEAMLVVRYVIIMQMFLLSRYHKG